MESTDTTHTLEQKPLSVRERLGKRVLIEDVEVEGFGILRIRRVTTSEALAISKSKENGGLELIQKSVVDESGNPLFSSVDAVKAVDFALMQQFLNACQKVNGVDKAAADAAKN